jgi:hypothetical protein
MSYKRVIQDLINLGHFDPIIRMIPLTDPIKRCLLYVTRSQCGPALFDRTTNLDHLYYCKTLCY